LKLDTWLTKEDVIVDLAESWGISDDGLTYTFKLREGVNFMTEGTGWGKEAVGDVPAAPGYGEEFTCGDAKASMEWYLWPEKGFFSSSHISGVRGYFRNVEGFTCPDGEDGHTLVMTVEYPRSGTVAWLAIGYKMWQADYLAWLNEHYPKIRYSYKEEGLLTNMGTGPFIPTAYEDMAYAKMKRNPDYFREGLPFVDGIEWYTIVDNTTRYAAWITGKVHFYGHGSDGLTPPQVAMTQRNYPDFEIHQVQHYLSFAVEFNLIAPPTDDVRVRQAFNLVFDRDAWWDLKAAGELEGSRMYMILLPDSPWGYSEEEIREMPGYRQPKDADIAEANRLLDEVFGAGVRPTDTKCISQDVAARSDNCLFATEQMRKATGWNIKMEIMGSAALSERTQNCEYRIFASSWDRSLATDPSGRFYEKYESGRFTRDCLRPLDADEVADTDARIAAQDIEMDPVKRKEMVRSLVHDMTYNRVAAATLGNVVNFWGTRPEVKGHNYIHVAYYGSWPQYERVWLNEAD